MVVFAEIITKNLLCRFGRAPLSRRKAASRFSYSVRSQCCTGQTHVGDSLRLVHRGCIQSGDFRRRLFGTVFSLRLARPHNTSSHSWGSCATCTVCRASALERRATRQGASASASCGRKKKLSCFCPLKLALMVLHPR